MHKVSHNKLIEQIEVRTHKFCDPGMPNMTVMMRPVFPYRPVISPAAIYELHKNRGRGKKSCGRDFLSL